MIQEIIDKYNEALQIYCDKVMPHFDPWIQREITPYQPILKYLFDLYLFCTYLVDEEKIFGKPQPNLDKIKVLYSKSALSLLGVYRCLSFGLAPDAMVIVRSLFEGYVTVKFILQEDTEERLRLYSQYEIVARWLNIKVHEELLESGMRWPGFFRQPGAVFK